MKTIDTAVLAGYNAGIERDRLRTGIGLIEFERTKEILLEKLPKAPSVIYDIGGAYATLERIEFTGTPDRGSLTNYRLKIK